MVYFASQRVGWLAFSGSIELDQWRVNFVTNETTQYSKASVIESMSV